MTSVQSANPRPKWLVYLLLGRVSNLPTVWSNCLAGAILAGGLADPGGLEPATIAVLLAALSLFYTSGMFLNDAFDHRFDREMRPERPIPSGDIPVGQVYLLGTLMMAAGGVVLAFPLAWRPGYNWAPVLAGGVVLGGLIVYYNYRHKSDPLSPVVMALCRAATYFIAAAAVTPDLPGALTPPVLAGAAVLSAYLIGLTYVAKQENLKEVGNLWPLVFLFAPFAYALTFLTEWGLGVVVYGGFLIWVLFAISFLVRSEGRSIPRAVISLIAGISLLDALLIAGSSPSISWVLAAVAAFVLTIAFQRFVPGT